VGFLETKISQMSSNQIKTAHDGTSKSLLNSIARRKGKGFLWRA